MRGFFVAGTGTGVGKTTIAAALLRRFPEARYWKPVQTGQQLGDDDTSSVRALSRLEEHRVIAPSYQFAAPLSPHLAAEAEQCEIAPRELLRRAKEIFEAKVPVIVEGAGGVLVPFTESYLQIDFMAAIDLPVMLVAEDRLGAINATLLTLEACRSRGIRVAGVLLNRSSAESPAGNAESIRRIGRVAVLAHLPQGASPQEALDAFAWKIPGTPSAKECEVPSTVFPSCLPSRSESPRAPSRCP